MVVLVVVLVEEEVPTEAHDEVVAHEGEFAAGCSTVLVNH